MTRGLHSQRQLQGCQLLQMALLAAAAASSAAATDAADREVRAAPGSTRQLPQRPPRVILFQLGDDYGYDNVGFAHGPAATPNPEARTWG